MKLLGLIFLVILIMACGADEAPSVAERETVLPSSPGEIEISTFTPERESVIPPASGEVQISTFAPEPETVVPPAPDEIEISTFTPEREAVIPPASGEVQISTFAPEPETVVPPVPDEIEISTFTPEREAVIPPASGEVQISTFAPEPETVVPPAPDEIEISISAPKLYTAYMLNPVNADREYTQKIASITGQVAAIANEDGKYLVKLFGGAAGASAISIGILDFMMIMETIICQVDKGDEHSVDRIASVTVGSHVTIVGWIEGMVARNIQITNCNIQ